MEQTERQQELAVCDRFCPPLDVVCHPKTPLEVATDMYYSSIVDNIERISAECAANRLVLVAPAAMITHLHQRLSGQAKERIAIVLPQDLSGVMRNNLLPHLQDVLIDAQKVRG